eukprot:4843529-Alexandrium_andersonii.AAC.1
MQALSAAAADAKKKAEDALKKKPAGKRSRAELIAADSDDGKGELEPSALGQSSSGGARPSLMKRPSGAASVRASYTIEWSREQVMCRSGLPGPGQNKGFAFKKCGGKDGAIAQAERWVKAKNKELKLA